MSRKKWLLVSAIITVVGISAFIIIYLTTNNKLLAFPFLICTQVIDLTLSLIMGE